MGANSFGQRFVVTTFGESHGVALGAVVDGCPAGIAFDEALLRRELERRRPGTSDVVSGRIEHDLPEVLSGVWQGKTLGTPIAIIVRNGDARPQDYDALTTTPRVGHADDVWRQKFSHADYRGGGRASGRETVARVMGGAVAQMLCRVFSPEMRVAAHATRIGDIVIARLKEGEEPTHLCDSADLRAYLRTLKERGESCGGIIEIDIDGVPVGLGQPVFHKLKSDLATALMSVGAVVGVELGDGFAAATQAGSQFHAASVGQYGGIRGGISTGERIVLRAAVKPTSTIGDTARQGRHDPCIVPRVLPVLEAMVWMVLADQLLWMLTDRPRYT